MYLYYDRPNTIRTTVANAVKAVSVVNIYAVVILAMKDLARSTSNVPIIRSGVGIVHVFNIVLVSTTLTSMLGLWTNKSLFLHVR